MNTLDAVNQIDIGFWERGLCEKKSLSKIQAKEFVNSFALSTFAIVIFRTKGNPSSNKKKARRVTSLIAHLNLLL